MFMFFSAFLASFTSVIVGAVTTDLDLSPETTPKQYGQVIAIVTILPSIAAVPLFYFAGRKYAAAKNAETLALETS